MFDDTAEDLQSITHAEFAIGMRNGTLGCWLAEPFHLHNGLGKALFNLLFLLYVIGPLIFVPLWAYHAKNWWFSIGIPVAYLAITSAAKYSRVVYYFGCYWVGFVVHHGLSLYHYTTFYFLCSASGYLVWHLADTVRMGCARRSLVDRHDIYDNAIDENRLRIIKLDSAGNEILTPEDLHAFRTTGLLSLNRFPTVLVFSNIVIEALTYLFGFFTGVIGTAIAHVRGINNLAPDRADSIMRQLKRGTVGLLAVYSDTLVRTAFGGLWQASYTSR
jgi:hypothetical protein